MQSTTTEIHGGPEKAILLVASETVDEFIRRGYPLFYGALGENLTSRGLDLRGLRIGDQLCAGGALALRSPSRADRAGNSMSTARC